MLCHHVTALIEVTNFWNFNSMNLVRTELQPKYDPILNNAGAISFKYSYKYTLDSKKKILHNFPT
jgi:hypothetical protein